MFMLNSELDYEFYHEMANKCHDQNSGHGRNHNEIFMIQYWIIMTLRSGYIMIYYVMTRALSLGGA